MIDTNKTVLDKFYRLAKSVAECAGVNLKIEASTDRSEVLKDSDFVVLSFANNTIHYRDLDCSASKKYGIRMCPGGAIGPGGIF